jgi:hypothetical protein
MSFVSSLVGGILGSNAANQAASVESQSATQAQNLEKQNQTNAINSQNTATSTNQANEAPYQALGSTSAGQLQSLLGTGFTAPTAAQAEQNPGYQFALESGTHALNENGAATGTLMTGTQGTALQQYGQQLGEQNYQQVYNNALQNYMTNYSTLMGGTQVGTNAVSEEGQLGQAGANNLSNVDLTGGQQQAQQINNAAAARASGYLGTAKAWGTAAGGMAEGLDNVDFTGGSNPLEMGAQLLGA